MTSASVLFMPFSRTRKQQANIEFSPAHTTFESFKHSVSIQFGVALDSLKLTYNGAIMDVPNKTLLSSCIWMLEESVLAFDTTRDVVEETPAAAKKRFLEEAHRGAFSAIQPAKDALERACEAARAAQLEVHRLETLVARLAKELKALRG